MSDNMPRYLEKSRQWCATTLIFAGTLGVIAGIILSLYQASCNHSMLDICKSTLISSIILLAGTFGLGCGFYLKGNRNQCQKLSEYGHFMLGLAALITLPQAPEMLRNIMEIRGGVEALNESQKKITSILEELRTQITNKAYYEAEPIIDEKSPEEIKKMIRSLTRAQPSKNSNYAMQLEFSNNKSVDNRSKWGAAFLRPENADKIISLIEDKNFTKENKENVKLELRKSLEVWGLNNKLPSKD